MKQLIFCWAASAAIVVGAHEGCATHAGEDSHGETYPPSEASCVAGAMRGEARSVHEHDESERGVEVSERAAEAIGLTVARPERRRVASTHSLYGRVVADPLASRTVALPLAGFVPCVVRPHDDVASGDELARLTSPDAAALFAEIQTLSARLDAVTRAGAKNAALASELAAKRAAYAALTYGLKAVDAAAGAFALTAPAAGRVTDVLAAPGGFVERGAAVLRLLERRPPVVCALVPVSDARTWTDGLAADVGAARGTIRLDRTRTDGLVGVWVSGLADAALTMGETVRVTLETDAHETPVLCVPSAAVFQDGLTPSVFVRDDHDADRFVAHAVGLGASAGGWTAVTGLADDAEVVVQGVYELKQALPSLGGEKKVAGHFHADGKFHAGDEGHD